MNFCSHCGNRVEQRIPEGDHQARWVCTHCGMIHYQNPKIVAGCIVESDGCILLARRNIEPRKGYWTLPAGFMEMGETTAEGAARETFEETGAEVTISALYAMFDIPHISQVYMLYRADLGTSNYGPTPESTDVALFAEDEIPWDQLAFPVVSETLRRYFRERPSGTFTPQVGTIHIRLKPALG